MATTIQRLMDWREGAKTEMDAIDADTAELIWNYFDDGTCIGLIGDLVHVDPEIVELVLENGQSEPYCPTEEQIKAACREIRKGWDRKERRKRRAMSTTPWTPIRCKQWEIDRDE